MQCLVVSTSGILFEKAVKSVVIPTVLGEVGILDKHIPFASMLKKGKVSITHLGEAAARELIEIDGGYASVSSNKLTILTGDKSLS